MICRRLIPRDLSTGAHKELLCMTQYDRIFRCYREPRIAEDILHYKPIPHGNDVKNRKEHVIVMYNNQVNYNKIFLIIRLMKEKNFRKIRETEPFSIVC